MSAATSLLGINRPIENKNGHKKDNPGYEPTSQRHWGSKDYSPGPLSFSISTIFSPSLEKNFFIFSLNYHRMFYQEGENLL